MKSINEKLLPGLLCLFFLVSLLYWIISQNLKAAFSGILFAGLFLITDLILQLKDKSRQHITFADMAAVISKKSKFAKILVLVNILGGAFFIILGFAGIFLAK